MRLHIPRVLLIFAVLALAAVAALSARPRPSAAPAQADPPAVATPALAAVPAPEPVQEPVVVSEPAERATVKTSSSTSHESWRPGEAGMRVELDPETGMLGPARSAPARLEPSEAEALNRSSEGLVEVTLPDGSVMMDLQGRFQEYVMMEIGPDGKRRTRCVQDPRAPKPPAAPAEVLQ